MQSEAYTLMARLEAEHWWYRGRRAVIRRLLRRLELPTGARLLDLGTGTGGNLDLLAEHGRAFGVEPSPEALALGSRAWAGRVARGRGDGLPFRRASFDLVAALDVIEHLHEELSALDEIRRVLRPGGHAVLFVPAYRSLWGHEDVISRHYRRYRASEIRRLLVASGFELVHLGYAITTLLPFIATVKVAKQLFYRGEVRSDITGLPQALLNDALATLLEVEAEVTATAEVPFGASILAVGRRD